MDLVLTPDLEKLRRSVADFVDREILPVEDDPEAFGQGENIRADRLEALRTKVKAARLWCPQMPAERGGLDVGPVGMAVLYEEMGRSRFGPIAFNCAAPDDGNMWV